MEKYCDLSCEYADFPDDDALAGDCHRAQVLYCRKLGRLAHKNNPCLEKNPALKANPKKINGKKTNKLQ